MKLYSDQAVAKSRVEKEPDCGFSLQPFWVQRRHQAVRQGSVRIWIPNRHVDLRKPVSGKRCGRIAHDSSET